MNFNEICKCCNLNQAASEYFNLDNDLLFCHICAEKIMENVHMARYGEYLRWENKPKPLQGYKKKRIPEKLKAQVHEKYNYQCVSCGTNKDLSCDHIVPESKGGETELDNLQTMCRSCNSSKGSKL